MSPAGSERDPEMIERVRKALDDELDFYDSMAPTREQITSACVALARAEVRRELVEELERLRESADFDGKDEPGWSNAMRHMRSRIDARLRELRGETEQGPGAATVADSTEQRAQGSAEAGGSIPPPGATTSRPGSSPRASDTAQTAAKDAGSTPAPGTPLVDRASESYWPSWGGAYAAQVRAEQSEVAAGSRAPERVENAQADLPAPASSAPALSDADRLDVAAKILDRHMECSVAGQVRNLAESLRADEAKRARSILRGEVRQ